MELTDIHCHILPEVDDGSQSMEQSIAMLDIAARNAIHTIILTPHNKPSRHHLHAGSMEMRRKALEDAAREAGISIKLLNGSELLYRMGLPEELREGEALTMAGSHYVLLEFRPADDYDYLRNGVYELLSEGYLPIVAHAERYRCLTEHPERVEELHGMGAYIQLNAGSIMGELGFGIKRFTKSLLKKELVHFVATDAHDTAKRKPELKKCADHIVKKYGQVYAQRIFAENPSCILQDEII